MAFEHMTSQALEYYTSKLRVQIGEHYYDKEEIDNKLGHNAQAYYYDADVWEQENPVLQPGELGIDATNGFMKIGDGIHSWNDMDYAIFPVSLSKRGDNLLLKDGGDNLFLSEALMKKLMLDVINQYHSDAGDAKEFVTADGYTFVTADEYTFVHR